MQHQLPFFPESTKLVNGSVGVYTKEEFVYYLHNGSPVFCHAKDDRNSYRYILANLVVTGLCNSTELGHALGIHERNVQRYAISLREHGIGYFFNREETRGQCHKFTQIVKEQAQSLLDKGESQLHVAQTLGISESAIRYHLRKGNLFKKK